MILPMDTKYRGWLPSCPKKLCERREIKLSHIFFGQQSIHCGASTQSWYFVEHFWHVPLAVELILQLLCSPIGKRNFRKKKKTQHLDWVDASLILGEIIAPIVQGHRAISIWLALFWSVAVVHPLAVPVLLPRGRVWPRPRGGGDPGRLGYPPHRDRRCSSPSPVGERWKTGPGSGNACEKGVIVRGSLQRGGYRQARIRGMLGYIQTYLSNSHRLGWDIGSKAMEPKSHPSQDFENVLAYRC